MRPVESSPNSNRFRNILVCSGAISDTRYTGLLVCTTLAARGVGAAEEVRPLTEHDDIDQSDLPDIGDSAGALISPEQERLLGQGFMREMRRQAPLVTDEQL